VIRTVLDAQRLKDELLKIRSRTQAAPGGPPPVSVTPASAQSPGITLDTTVSIEGSSYRVAAAPTGTTDVMGIYRDQELPGLSSN
jgi:hypothetical protein